MIVALISSVAGLLRQHSTLFKLTASVLVAVMFSQTGISQTVGLWNFNNTTTGTAGPNNTVSNATIGPAIGGGYYSGATVWYGEGGWPTGALDPSAYVQFTLTPNTSYELNLTNITLELRRSTTGSPSGSGPQNWSIRSSLDGFTSDINGGTLSTNFATYSVPLNSTYHHIYTTITFRVYGFNAFINSGGLNRFVFDDVRIQGLTGTLAIATPTPVVRNPTQTVSDAAINYVSVRGNSFIVGMQSPANQRYDMMIYSTTGALLQRRTVQGSAGHSQVVILVDGLPHGLYTMSLYNGKLVNSKSVLY